MNLEIVLLGSKVLRLKATQIEDVNNPDVQRLAKDLISTVMSVNGVGIAAPQVDKSIQMFIMASHPNARYPNAPLIEPFAVINPTITAHSDSMHKDWEGCLSIPGIRALVPRYTQIDVSYLDINGKENKATYSDFLARIFQHEYDHLQGIVFLDRLESNKDIITEQEYQKLINKLAN